MQRSGFPAYRSRPDRTAQLIRTDDDASGCRCAMTSAFARASRFAKSIGVRPEGGFIDIRRGDCETECRSAPAVVRRYGEVEASTSLGQSRVTRRFHVVIDVIRGSA